MAKALFAKERSKMGFPLGGSWQTPIPREAAD